MKIALLIWELNIKGGTQRQALELARNLSDAGHHVDIYSYIYDKKNCYEDLCDQLNIYSVENKLTDGNDEKIVNEKSFWYRVSTLISIYSKLIKEFLVVDPRIYKLNSLIENKKGAIFYDVINLHDYGVYRISRLLQHNNIVWMMNDIQRPPSLGKKYPHRILLNFLKKVLVRYEIKNIHKIAVLDKRNQNLCSNYYDRHSIVVRSGIDLKMFNEINIEKNFDKKKFLIFASGIFFPYRRYEDVVEAVKILVNKGLTNIRVLINGSPKRSPGYYSQVKQKIFDYNLSYFISMTSGLTEKELLHKYTEADFFVFPNNPQTWGLSVFEAMLAGCVTLVSKGAGAHEVLTNHENAILFNPEQPQELAEALSQLITNPSELNRISKNGTNFVKNNLSWDSYARQMIGIFKKINVK